MKGLRDVTYGIELVNCIYCSALVLDGLAAEVLGASVSAYRGNGRVYSDIASAGSCADRGTE